MNRKIMILLIALIIVLFLTTQCSPAPSNTETSSPSTLDGKTLVDTKCTSCHGIDRIENASKDAAGWKTTVERMVGKGAELSSEEQTVVIEYLAKTYP